MIEIIIGLAAFILLWMMWRLYQAKQYNRFIDWLNVDISPKLAQVLIAEMEQNRSELFPNTEDHIHAALMYYRQYPVRIFEAAVAREVIEQGWLIDKPHKRWAAHLLFIQAAYRLKNG